MSYGYSKKGDKKLDVVVRFWLAKVPRGLIPRVKSIHLAQRFIIFEKSEAMQGFRRGLPSLTAIRFSSKSKMKEANCSTMVELLFQERVIARRIREGKAFPFSFLVYHDKNVNCLYNYP